MSKHGLAVSMLHTLLGSRRPLTLTFRRNILKKNRAMIVTENVWTNIKKKGMSLLGKVCGGGIVVECAVLFRNFRLRHQQISWLAGAQFSLKTHVVSCAGEKVRSGTSW